jgi:hypothetical protein
MSTFDEACLRDEVTALRLKLWHAEEERERERVRGDKACESLSEADTVLAQTCDQIRKKHSRERLAMLDELNARTAERDATRAVVEAARDAWSHCDPTSKAFQILDQALRKHDGTESHSIDGFLAAAKGGER